MRKHLQRAVTAALVMLGRLVAPARVRWVELARAARHTSRRTRLVLGTALVVGGILAALTLPQAMLVGALVVVARWMW